MQRAIFTAAGDRGYNLILRPFLNEVLKKGKADAWVCSTESTALAAVSHLRSQGRRVPEDISVVGFDNWAQSHEHQLSSYDFNMVGMVQRVGSDVHADKKQCSSPAVCIENLGAILEKAVVVVKAHGPSPFLVIPEYCLGELPDLRLS